MESSDKEIDAFMKRSGTMEARRQEVAIVFAQSMVVELRATVAKWEMELIRLCSKREGAFAEMN